MPRIPIVAREYQTRGGVRVDFALRASQEKRVFEMVNLVPLIVGWVEGLPTQPGIDGQMLVGFPRILRVKAEVVSTCIDDLAVRLQEITRQTGEEVRHADSVPTDPRPVQRERA